MAQRVGRGIALLFHDRGARRGSVVSSTPRPHFTPGKCPVPILREFYVGNTSENAAYLRNVREVIFCEF